MTAPVPVPPLAAAADQGGDVTSPPPPAPTDRVLDALAGFRELPEWLAVGMDGERVRSAVAEATAGVDVLACEPQRLRAKEDRWLCRYRLQVAGPDRVPHELVLTGELVPPGPRRDDWEAAVPGLALENGGGAVWLPELGLDLRATPSDDALPALPALVDPGQARHMVEAVLRAAGRPGLRLESCDPDVVRYKPGSRCTIVYRLRYPGAAEATWPALVVAKTHQGDKGAVAWDAMRTLWGTDLARGDVVTLAEPLAFDAARRVLVQGPVPGSATLKDLLRDALVDDSAPALDAVREALFRTALGLAALHTSGVRYGGRDTWEDEFAEVGHVVERLATSIPSLRAAAEPLLIALRARADATPADPEVSAHHDFRPAQVLLHEGRVGFIDFDGSCSAEPALDIGRFTAKLRDIAISTPAAGGEPLRAETLGARLALADDLAEHFVRAYETCAPVSRARVVLWETTDLLTGMLHAWTKVRVRRVGPRLTLLEHHLRSAAAAR